MKITSEKELCEKFIAAHPRSEHLYYEVYVPSGRADIVHKERAIITIYEAKMRLSLELLEQCINRKPYAHFVYAVIPESKKRNYLLERFFRDYGIGVISFYSNQYFDNSEEFRKYRQVVTLREFISPKFFRSPEPIKLYEENKKEIAGSQNAGITPFGIMVKNIKEKLSNSRSGKVSVDKLFDCQSYYGTLKQFKTNIYQWIRKGVITGIEMEKGMLWLKVSPPDVTSIDIDAK